MPRWCRKRRCRADPGTGTRGRSVAELSATVLDGTRKSRGRESEGCRRRTRPCPPHPRQFGKSCSAHASLERAGRTPRVRRSPRLIDGIPLGANRPGRSNAADLVNKRLISVGISSLLHQRLGFRLALVRLGWFGGRGSVSVPFLPMYRRCRHPLLIGCSGVALDLRERPVNGDGCDLVIQPASASIRAAVFRRPCRTQASGRPASSMASANHMPRPLLSNALPSGLVSRLMWPPLV